MQTVLAPTLNTITVGKAPAQPINRHVFVARTEGPTVVWFIDDKRCEMTTTLAYETGSKVILTAGEAASNEAVLVTINGEEILIPTDIARQVGAALCRKADTADDFQMDNNIRIIKP